MRRLFRQFSFPGGIPSHVAPETPGRSTRAASSATRSRMPTAPRSTIRTCSSPRVVGDGEAETGALATSWHSNKFTNPVNDGVVLPILHLNGYKIANPTVLDRIPTGRTAQPDGRLRPQPVLLRSRTRTAMPPTRTGGSRPLLDTVLNEIAEIKAQCRGRRRAATALADDRLPHPEGMDRPGLHRRQEDHGILARTPGSARQRPRHPRTPAGARRLAGLLPRRRTVRRGRQARPEDRGTGAAGSAADERQPARQRRAAAEGSAAARLPELRRRRARARRDDRRGHQGARCSGSPT